MVDIDIKENNTIKHLLHKVKEQIGLDTIFFLVSLVLLSIFYFVIPLFFMPDSSGYYNYLSIFNGEVPISAWNTVRGPTFPTLIYIATKIGGKNFLSILTMSYLFYTSFLVVFWLVLRKMLITLKASRFLKIIVLSSFYVFIMFNPILFGYFHAFLTEFVAIFFGLISSILTWKWLTISFYKNKKLYIFYNIIFGFLFVFMWFLKQPYISIILFPLCCAGIISIAQDFQLKNILQRMLTLVSCLIILLLAIIVWDQFLVRKGVNVASSDRNQSFVSAGLIYGVSNLSFEYMTEPFDVDLLAQDKLLSEFDKGMIRQILLDEEETWNFRILRVESPSGERIDKMVLYYEGDTFSLQDSIRFLGKVFLRHPLVVIDSYFANYLATSNVWTTMMDLDYYFFYPERTFNPSGYENRIIALAFFEREDNFMWIYQDEYKYYEELQSLNNPDLLPEEVESVLSVIHHNVFKMLFCILPLISILAVLRYIKTLRLEDKEIKISYMFILILLFSALFHVLLHVVTGAIIDRYIFVVFPEVILAILLIIIVESNRSIKFSSS